MSKSTMFIAFTKRWLENTVTRAEALLNEISMETNHDCKNNVRPCAV